MSEYGPAQTLPGDLVRPFALPFYSRRIRGERNASFLRRVRGRRTTIGALRSHALLEVDSRSSSAQSLCRRFIPLRAPVARIGEPLLSACARQGQDPRLIYPFGRMTSSSMRICSHAPGHRQCGIHIPDE